MNKLTILLPLAAGCMLDLKTGGFGHSGGTSSSSSGSALASSPSSPHGPTDPPAPHWNDPTPPGVETLKPSAPTWCAGYKPRPWLPGNMLFDDISKEGYSEQMLQEIAQLACDRPDDPARQAWIAFYRQGWLNIVGTTDAEDREAMAARMQLKQQEAEVQAVCKPLHGAAYSKDDERAPSDRMFDHMRAEALGCNGTANLVKRGELGEASYWVDRSAEPPDELVRLDFVLRCFQTDNGASSIDPKFANVTLGNYAFCGHDARKLDRAGFDKAIAAYKLPPLARARARENFAFTQKLLASMGAAYRDLAAKDPAYKRLFVDEPERGFSDWIKQRAANKSALDGALAMEDKFRDEDKHAVAGCGATLRKQLEDHVRSRAPKNSDAVVDAVNDDVGQPLLHALLACDALEGRFTLVQAEHELVGHGRVRRGPRTAAFWHTLDVVAELGKDKPKKQFVQPEQFGGPLPYEYGDTWTKKAYEMSFNHTSFIDQKGQIASLARQGDGFLVTFKRETYEEPTLDCHDTDHIDQITPDGHVIYRQSCRAVGMHTVDATALPAWIRASFAAELKPGMFLELHLDERQKPYEGYAKAVYADKAHKYLVQYWGFPVAH
jgi:hypothetical protein